MRSSPIIDHRIPTLATAPGPANKVAPGGIHIGPDDSDGKTGVREGENLWHQRRG